MTQFNPQQVTQKHAQATAWSTVPGAALTREARQQLYSSEEVKQNQQLITLLEEVITRYDNAQRAMVIGDPSGFSGQSGQGSFSS